MQEVVLDMPKSTNPYISPSLYLLGLWLDESFTPRREKRSLLRSTVAYLCFIAETNDTLRVDRKRRLYNASDFLFMFPSAFEHLFFF